MKNRYPLPMIDNLFEQISGASWCPKIDICSEYHYIQVREDDVPKTTFRTQYEHYEFVVMYFG